jgi:hypothetical protein
MNPIYRYYGRGPHTASQSDLRSAFSGRRGGLHHFELMIVGAISRTRG